MYCEEEYNECLSAPCQNYATYRDIINAYECVCTAPYEGVCSSPSTKTMCASAGGIGDATCVVTCVVMYSSSLQGSTVRCTETPVRGCTARTAATARVRDSTPPVSVHLDTWVRTRLECVCVCVVAWLMRTPREAAGSDSLCRLRGELRGGRQRVREQPLPPRRHLHRPILRLHLSLSPRLGRA